MKFTLPMLLLVLLSGCYGQGPAYYSYEGMQAIDRQLCDRIADAYHFTGSTRQQYMGLCIGSGGGGSVAMVPITPYPYPNQYSTIGQPDQFGPLGYRGPTWEQFNQRFTSPQR